MIDPNLPPRPIEFDQSASKAVLGTLAGALLILATGLPTLLALVKARDVIALLRWVQGADGLAFATAAGLVLTIGWRIWSAIRRHARAVIAARAAPNRVALVKGEADAWRRG